MERYMENNYQSDYPYGIFPQKHTKSGQTKVQQIETAETPKQETSGLDISRLLPLITLMNSKKNISQSEMFSILLPLLTGKDIDINSLLKTINNSDEEEAEDLMESVKISTYKKIE